MPESLILCSAAPPYSLCPSFIASCISFTHCRHTSAALIPQLSRLIALARLLLSSSLLTSEPHTPRRMPHHRMSCCCAARYPAELPSPTHRVARRTTAHYTPCRAAEPSYTARRRAAVSHAALLSCRAAYAIPPRCRTPHHRTYRHPTSNPHTYLSTFVVHKSRRVEEASATYPDSASIYPPSPLRLQHEQRDQWRLHQMDSSQ